MAQQHGEVFGVEGVEERSVLTIGFEGGLKLLVEPGVGVTMVFEERSVFVVGQIEELIEEGFDLLPAFGAQWFHRALGLVLQRQAASLTNLSVRGGRLHL